MKFEDYLNDNTSELESVEPSTNLWGRIDSEITAIESKSYKSRIKFILLILGLIGIGIISWIYISNQYAKAEAIQIAQNKLDTKLDEIKYLLTQTKTSSRLKAINKVGFIEKQSDERVPDMLLNIVKSDPSLPVKFAALNALEEYVDHESVRIRLIKILTSSDDNKLKIRVLSFLSQVNEERIEPFLDGIIKDKSSPELWKSEAVDALEKINKI